MMLSEASYTRENSHFSHLADALNFGNRFPSHTVQVPFNHCFVLFFTVPRVSESAHKSFGDSSLRSVCWGWVASVPRVHLPYPFLCGASLTFVQKLLSQSSVLLHGNCSVYRCKFNVFVGRGEFRVFLHCHLGPEVIVAPCDACQPSLLPKASSNAASSVKQSLGPSTRINTASSYSVLSEPFTCPLVHSIIRC